MILQIVVYGQKSENEEVELSYPVKILASEATNHLSTIGGVIEDEQGFLWFVTDEGLHVFDGNTLLTYNNSGVPGSFGLTKKGDGYLKLSLGKNNILWLIENQSHFLVAIDVVQRKVVKIIEEVSSLHTGELHTLDNGTSIWATGDLQDSVFIRCLSCPNTDRRYLLSNKDYKTSTSFHDQIWIKLPDGFYRYDSNFNLVKTYNEYQQYFFEGPSLEGLFFFNPANTDPLIWNEKADLIQPIHKLPIELKQKAYKIYRVENESWFYNNGDQLLYWNQENNLVENYTNYINNSLFSKTKSGLSGSYVFGTQLKNKDLVFFRENNLILIERSKSNITDFKTVIESKLDKLSMRGLVEDDAGSVYVSYYTGLAKKTKGLATFIPFLDTESRNKLFEQTYSLSFWKDHLIWNYTVFDLRKNQQQNIFKEGYGQHVVHCMDSDTLWTYEWYNNHLIKYDLNAKKILFENPRIYRYDILASDMKIDPTTGNLWLASEFYGFLIYNREGHLIKKYTPEELQLPINKKNIFCFEFSDEGIWFGSEVGFGLFQPTSGKVTYFNGNAIDKNEMVFNKKTYSMIKDTLGNFYLGTGQGISYFNTKTKKLSHLVNDHPLAKVEFNRNSTLYASDGKYYFGSIDGLYSFYPNELKFEDELSIQAPTIAQILVFNLEEAHAKSYDKNLYHLEKINLKYNDSNLSILFSSPSLQQPLFYSFLIPGLINQWTTPSTNGKLELLSCPPGSYEVYARAYAVPYGQTFAESHLQIFKAEIWYKKTWMQLLLVLLGGGLIGLWFRTRYKRKLAQKEAYENLRVKISSDLHDEVGSLLSGLAMQSDIIAIGLPGEKKQAIQEIGSMGREAMESMRDIVWSIDSRKDKYENLIDRMRHFAEKNLENKNIDHTFLVEGIDLSNPIDPQLRQNIYLIFKEAITNILKHSNADKVDIRFTRKSNITQLSIKDNGNHVNAGKSDGMGLKNMEMRAKALGGKFEVEAGKGFEVKVSLG